MPLYPSFTHDQLREIQREVDRAIATINCYAPPRIAKKLKSAEYIFNEVRIAGWQLSSDTATPEDRALAVARLLELFAAPQPQAPGA